MKLVENTLSLEIETWDDPGDYPNAVAFSPLPSTSNAVIIGHVVFEFDKPEDFENFDDLSEWIWNYVDLNISHVTWNANLENNICTVTVSQFEINQDDEHDYYEFDDL